MYTGACDKQLTVYIYFTTDSMINCNDVHIHLLYYMHMCMFLPFMEIYV